MYQWIKNIVWHVYMIYKTSNSSFFDIPKDKAVKRVQHFDKLECIDKMNEIFKEFSNEVKYFSSDNKRWNISEDGIHDEKKEFFEKLLYSEYFNGDNFPIKYKNELENFHELLKFPIIYTKMIKYGNLIFNNIKLSTSGNELKSKFRNLIIINNEGSKLYHNFCVKVEELHKRFLHSDLNNELVWDQASFKLIDDIRNLFDLYKKNHDGIYKSFYEFSCIFQYFYKEWLYLNYDQKCSLLFDFNVKDYSKSFLKSIYKECTNKKEEIEEIYKRLHAFIDQGSYLISKIKVNSNILGIFLNFVFDCELFSSKCEKFRLFAVVFKGFYNKPQYKNLLTHVNKYDLLFSDVENLKSNVMKNEVLQTTKEIVYKRILLTINSQSKPFEDFIATKDQTLKRLNLTGKNKLIKLFQKYLELSKKDLEKLIKDLANMNYCCNLIPKNRLEYYSAYSFFSSYDSSAELAALINMKSEFQKQLGFLRCGSKNSCDKSRYLETEKRIRQFESGINDQLGSSYYFYYPDDEILSSSS